MIYDTYAAILTEQIIRDLLTSGTPPSTSAITEAFEDFVADNDISQPLFIANNHRVEFKENASAAKYNLTNFEIRRDLKVLYRHLLNVSEMSITQFDRWRTEASVLEKRLNALNERITSLLLISEDTAGYFNFFQDNFNDNSKVDLVNTTAYVNVAKNIVSLGTTSIGSTRIDLSTLNDRDVEFSVLTRKNYTSHVSSQGSQTRYAISDANNYWQEKVYMKSPGPVTTELKIKMLSVKSISRIDLDLHMSNQTSSVQITPMYSVDNYNWSQLPITGFTRSVIDKATFQFPVIEAQYVKFLMTKAGYDQVHNELYAYEFGVDDISFYDEGFAADTDGVLISQPLSILDTDGNPQQFGKITLEVCEDVPDNTTINYYVNVATNAAVPLTGFTAIDPINRAGSVNPTVLDFGDIDFVTISGISISYDPAATGVAFVNPAKSFRYIESISGSTPVESTASTTTVSGTRYSFLNSNDRILNVQMNTDIDFVQNSLEVWRNVNTVGSIVKVRGYSNGWGFEEPYYKTTVLVDNVNGHAVDFGGKAAVIDGEPKVGKVTLAKGRHTLWIHKDNWKLVDDTVVTDLTTLKTADPLYPYNHRYLVEGFKYPTVYPTTEEKIYRGFDLVAEHFMKAVSIFDIIHNVPKTDYSRFALDLDTGDSHRTLDTGEMATSPSTVFTLKIDERLADFINEKFVIRFKSVNALFTHLRFKAVLSTKDANITPFLDSYRIRLSS